MSRRIGKRTREAAIHCLEQCASDRIGAATAADLILDPFVVWCSSRELTCAHDVEDGAALVVASEAWFEASGLLPGWDLRGAIGYLEAAALLRDGWNPGDPVEVRR